MKKLSSIFIAIAVFCFVAFTSCQGTSSSDAEAEPQEEMMEEAASEVEDIEEAVDSTASDEMAEDEMMSEDEAAE